MHRRLLPLLACPSCRTGYDCVVHAGDDERIESGYLRCPRCAIVVPVLDGLVMFTEPLLHAGLATPEALAALASRLFGSEQDFEAYRRDKRQRGVVESYAAFAPFNESTRVLEPLLPHAAANLRDGDAILDTWCRSGWSGEWLAGLCPRQHVVSLWEGNSSVLGYRGFRHLLGTGQRAANLDILFCSLEKPLPFRDECFGLTYAYDSLHRYGLLPFAGECLRVTRADAAVLFAHLHLSNSEPEPFFERGCQQRHGREYRQWLQDLELGPTRRGWVMSEAAVFDGPAVAELADDAETAHYNGLVAILPNAILPNAILPEARPEILARDEGGDRFVLSPLFQFHLGRSSARVGRGLFEGAVGHLLQRHPVYQARMPVAATQLEEMDWLALLLATLGYEQAWIEASFNATEGVAAALAELCRREILFRAPVSAAGHRLQRFHGNQLPLAAGSMLVDFWSALEAQQQNLLQLADGDCLGGEQISMFSASVCALLASEGLRSGQRIAVVASAHPLLMLAGLAAVSAGYDVEFASAGELLAFEDLARADFVLFADGQSLPAGLRGLPLGLQPDTETLLSRLQPVEGGMQAWLQEEGQLSLPVGSWPASCRLSVLLEGLDSLSGQVETQLWLFEGRSAFADLMAMLAAWRRGESLRCLPGARGEAPQAATGSDPA